MENIILIGMSGVGKSKYGKMLSKEYGYNFLDTDRLLEKIENKKIQYLAETLEFEEFINKEENAIRQINNIQNTIIATGGSCIYSENTMAHLKNIGKIIYLEGDKNFLFSSLNYNKEGRGIVSKGNKTYFEIFDEREKLYKKYADFIIENKSHNYLDISKQFKNIIKK